MGCVCESILDQLGFSHLPEGILRINFWDPKIFQLTWDLSLGKLVTGLLAKIILMRPNELKY